MIDMICSNGVKQVPGSSLEHSKFIAPHEDDRWWTRRSNPEPFTLSTLALFCDDFRVYYTVFQEIPYTTIHFH